MNQPQVQADKSKRPLSFCVVVESRLPEEATRSVLNAILDAGLAEASQALESEIDGELRQMAKDAVDMDVHAPVLMELPRLSTFTAARLSAESTDVCTASGNTVMDSGESLTVYAEAYAVDENGEGPRLAEFEVDAAFVEHLSRLHAVCIGNHLTEVRVDGGPDWGPYGIEDELRLQNHELVVTHLGDFWYTADVKHADYHVETRAVNIANFIEHVQLALARGDEYLRCDGYWSNEAATEAIAEYRDAKAAAEPSPH